MASSHGPSLLAVIGACTLALWTTLTHWQSFGFPCTDAIGLPSPSKKLFSLHPERLEPYARTQLRASEIHLAGTWNPSGALYDMVQSRNRQEVSSGYEIFEPLGAVTAPHRISPSHV